MLVKPQQPDLFGGAKPPPLRVLIVAHVNTYPMSHPEGWWGYGYGMIYTPTVIGYIAGGGGSGPTAQDATRRLYCDIRECLRVFPRYYTSKEERKMIREQDHYGSPLSRADRDVIYSITINGVLMYEDVQYERKL